jgi:aminoglycoside phosphotransferase (APT) family kinase protein
MGNDQSVLGLCTRKVAAWLSTVTEVKAPLEWPRLSGGNSNLTYLVRDSAGREMVIRRPPTGKLLPKAHDMWREYRVVRALWPTGVPVAEPIAYCDDHSVCDAHFYVMGKCQGMALFDAGTTEGWLVRPVRRKAALAFIRILATLHAVDPYEAACGQRVRHEEPLFPG